MMKLRAGKLIKDFCILAIAVASGLAVAPAFADRPSVADFNGVNGNYALSGLTIDAAGDLFGTTARGGVNGVGNIFELSSKGVLTSIADFSGANGAFPQGGLTANAAGDLFGTTSSGGADGYGNVFELTDVGFRTPSVPEPGTWTMMLVGIGIAGGSMRLRRKAHSSIAWRRSSRI